MLLEADESSKMLSPTIELSKLKEHLRKEMNVSEEHISFLFIDLELASSENGLKEPYSWNYYESCFFVGSLVTTIGKDSFYKFNQITKKN